MIQPILKGVVETAQHNSQQSAILSRHLQASSRKQHPQSFSADPRLWLQEEHSSRL
jgi:hypothetical protein